LSAKPVLVDILNRKTKVTEKVRENLVNKHHTEMYDHDLAYLERDLAYLERNLAYLERNLAYLYL